MTRTGCPASEPCARAGKPGARGFRLHWLAVLLTATGLAVSPGALAQTASGDAPLTTEHDFDIAAQPLPAALLAYSRASGVQVLVHSKTAARLRSIAIHGRMTGGAALRAMLQGTGYSIRYISSSSVTLVASEEVQDGSILQLNPLVVKAAPIMIGGRNQFSGYAESVLSELRRALQGEAFAEHDKFSITVRVWLDRGGHVERTEVQESTGDPALDAMVLRQLASVIVSVPPPESLPQPLRFRLWS